MAAVFKLATTHQILRNRASDIALTLNRQHRIKRRSSTASDIECVRIRTACPACGLRRRAGVALQKATTRMIGNLQHFFDRFVVLGDKLATKGADSWFRYYLQQKMSGNARASTLLRQRREDILR